MNNQLTCVVSSPIHVQVLQCAWPAACASTPERSFPYIDHRIDMYSSTIIIATIKLRAPEFDTAIMVQCTCLNAVLSQAMSEPLARMFCNISVCSTVVLRARCLAGMVTAHIYDMHNATDEASQGVRRGRTRPMHPLTEWQLCISALQQHIQPASLAPRPYSTSSDINCML